MGRFPTRWKDASICARAAAVHPDLEEVWAPFAGRFADLVRSSSRAGAGAA